MKYFMKIILGTLFLIDIETKNLYFNYFKLKICLGMSGTFGMGKKQDIYCYRHRDDNIYFLKAKKSENRFSHVAHFWVE